MHPDGDVERLAHEWEAFGREDPLWAVLTEPGRHGGRWSAEEFYETGRRDIGRVMRRLEELGVPAHRRTALDFGCGVGRLSRALATYFEHVVGVDIAPSMVDEARRRNADVPQCEFVCNQRADLSEFENSSVDLVYSDITLQHIPPRLGIAYVDEFLRLLAPGGVAMFHVPYGHDRSIRGLVLHYAPRPLLDAGRRAYFTWRGVPAIQEMYVIPAATIEAAATERGFRVLACDASNTAGKGWLGYRYTILHPA